MGIPWECEVLYSSFVGMGKSIKNGFVGMGWENAIFSTSHPLKYLDILALNK